MSDLRARIEEYAKALTEKPERRETQNAIAADLRAILAHASTDSRSDLEEELKKLRDMGRQLHLAAEKIERDPNSSHTLDLNAIRNVGDALIASAPSTESVAHRHGYDEDGVPCRHADHLLDGSSMPPSSTEEAGIPRSASTPSDEWFDTSPAERLEQIHFNEALVDELRKALERIVRHAEAVQSGRMGEHTGYSVAEYCIEVARTALSNRRESE